MRLKFTDSRVTEYKSGDFYQRNNGEPFEVDHNVGEDLVKVKHFIDGDYYPVFEECKIPSDIPTESEIKAMNKKPLFELAQKLNVEGATEDDNKSELQEKILKHIAALTPAESESESEVEGDTDDSDGGASGESDQTDEPGDDQSNDQ